MFLEMYKCNLEGQTDTSPHTACTLTPLWGAAGELPWALPCWGFIWLHVFVNRLK